MSKQSAPGAGAAVAVKALTDASRVAELHRLLHDAFAALAIEPPSGVLKETLDDFCNRLQRETALVAEATAPPDTGALVGGAFCIEQQQSLYVGRLAVRNDFRRRGVASALKRRQRRRRFAAASTASRYRPALRLPTTSRCLVGTDSWSSQKPAIPASRFRRPTTWSSGSFKGRRPRCDARTAGTLAGTGAQPEPKG